MCLKHRVFSLGAFLYMNEFYGQAMFKHLERSIAMLDKLALALVIIGALNWGGIGIFQYDLVAMLFGGSAAIGSRIVYTLVALAGIWAISFFFRDDAVNMGRTDPRS